MIRAAEKLYAELQTRLGLIRSQDICLQQVEQCFDVCNSAILALCEKIRKKGFTCRKEEILFFRSVKPKFVSLQRYYILLYNHFLFWPDEREEQLKYLERSLQKLDRISTEYNWFYSYYQSGSTDLDNKYFLRSGRAYCSTPGEILISDIMAQQELAEFIRRQISRIQSS